MSSVLSGSSCSRRCSRSRTPTSNATQNIISKLYSTAATTTLGKSLWSTETASDQSSNDWLREAVRMLNSARRSARAAQMALRSTSALLRPAENFVCASAISLGSAANCLLAASTYLGSLATGPESPVPGLFFALRGAAKSVCTGASNLSSQMAPLSRAMHSTAIALALAAASFEKAALEAMVSNSHRHRRDRTRSRSPHHESLSASRSETSRSGSTRSRTSRSGNSREGAPRNGTLRQERNVKISHILIKHKESRRPIDNNDKPVTRTKDQAMHIVIDIHEKIFKDLITFADAAVSYSECTSARRQGDIQNQFKVGRIQKSFEDAAFSLAPRQVSHIIESNSGYHILQRRE